MRTRFTILVVLVLVLSFASLPAGGVAGFGDVAADKYFTEPVQWMVDNSITGGTSPTCFSPGDPVTRGQAAAFMWRMEGSPTGAPAHSFVDVFASWQQAPVSWMVDNEITTGTTTTTFSPEDPVTRGQIAAFLWRLAGSPAAPPASQFTDVVKAWQITPVGWMVQQEITTGTTASTFSPEDTVTRGQAATFFYRYKGSPPVVVDPNHPTIPACAAQVPGPAGEMQLQGRFVGIDVEIPVGSYWEVAFSPNGQWNGIDSATNVCEGYLSRTWGEFWETGTPNAFGATINVECLEGPNEGMVFDLGEFSKPLIYDPVEDTILQDTTALPEGRDVTFCRLPCDPYDYYGGPW